MAPPPFPSAHDYRLDPTPYKALHAEQGVFNTPPYSNEIKGLWRYADEATAKKSAEEVFATFEKYRDDDDFIGMDTARKFIQMGRTRSLRYALRPGGRKYQTSSTSTSTSTPTPSSNLGKGKAKVGIPRTGEVRDEEKLRGAGVFTEYLEKVWADEMYIKRWEEWREKQGSDTALPKMAKKDGVEKYGKVRRRKRSKKVDPKAESVDQKASKVQADGGVPGASREIIWNP